MIGIGATEGAYVGFGIRASITLEQQMQKQEEKDFSGWGGLFYDITEIEKMHNLKKLDAEAREIGLLK